MDRYKRWRRRAPHETVAKVLPQASENARKQHGEWVEGGLRAFLQQSPHALAAANLIPIQAATLSIQANIPTQSQSLQRYKGEKGMGNGDIALRWGNAGPGEGTGPKTFGVPKGAF